MAWSNSKLFAAWCKDMWDRTHAGDMDGDSFKVALYDNDITPDNTVSAANSAYNAGQWTASGNEVSESGQWAAGGVVLVANDVTVSTTTITWDANDTASGSAADLANVYGAFVYDDTLTTPVADQGVCYNYLGGLNGIVNGTFTVVWAVAGIASLSVA